ncbi:hypothetical protein ACFY7H_22525 [Streptomyces sp. NPDC012794]|uniref:hypothetical protein n=1 Tax=Streptomyces sp. NPDC012794 TaxID=3364850 RepID=UPI0036B4067B
MFKQREIRQSAGGLAVAGRQSTWAAEHNGAAAKKHAGQERAAERYGLEPARSVQHLLDDAPAPPLDRSTTSGRIEAAPGHDAVRG